MLYDRFKCLLCSIIQNCQKQRHSNLCKLEVLTSLLQPSSTATTWWWRSGEKKGFSLPACFMFCHKVVQTQVQTCWRSSNLWHHETPSQHQVMQSPSKQRSFTFKFYVLPFQKTRDLLNGDDSRKAIKWLMLGGFSRSSWKNASRRSSFNLTPILLFLSGLDMSEHDIYLQHRIN